MFHRLAKTTNPLVAILLAYMFAKDPNIITGVALSLQVLVAIVNAVWTWNNYK
jgi:hypothetical protein